MTIVLVGMPASGKSSVGAQVAKTLGLTMTDTDALIEQRTGKLIREIFADEGEAVFRAAEEQAVAEALQAGGVVSLGGGAVLSRVTRERLRGHDVFLLDVSVTTATRRAGLTAIRPLLLGDVRDRLQTLLNERRPLYTEVATHTIATDRRKVSAIAAEIVRLLDEGGSR